MNSVPYISVTEFQTYNPELDFTGYQASTLSGMITRASERADGFMEHSLGLESFTLEERVAIVSEEGNLKVFPRKTPVQSVSDLRLKLGTSEITLSLTDGDGNARYEIPSEQDYILYPYQELSVTGTVQIRNLYDIRRMEVFTRVSYVAGYETIPEDVKDAVNLLTKDIFIRQANPMNLKSGNQGAINMQFKDKTDGKSDLVLEAEGILQKYKRVIL